MGINGCVALAERALEPGHPAREPVEQIRDAVESAASIARQLLAFTRRSTQTGRLFDVDAVTLRNRSLLRATVAENIELRYDLRASGLHVAGDRRHFEQALLNLVINARDAMRAGGELTIETRGVSLQEPLVRYERTLFPGEYVQLRVRDTGSGISSERLDRIFEPFFTTKELGRGTGLGLSMVYGTVQTMGGVIEVKSEVDLGTQFELLLPAIKGLDPSLEEPFSTGEQAWESSQPRNVLVVEDDPLVARTVVLLLQSDGHTAVRASSLHDARALLQDGNFDLLVTDAVLADAFGSSVALMAQEHTAAIDVIFMSAHSRQHLLDQERILPGYRFLSKPFDARDLRQALRDIEKQGRGALPTARIMVVDDHAPSLAALESVLSDLGLRVLSATSCHEARSTWRSQQVDTLLTDLRLPDGSGAELAREFREQRPDLRVIFTSGSPRDLAEREHELVPHTGYFEKPFDIDDLCLTLQTK